MFTSFAKIAEQVYHLSIDEKEALLGLLHAWIIEQRREEFAKNAQHARTAHAEGSLKRGSLDDFMAEIIEDAAMAKAIAAGEKSAPVGRNTIFQYLEYPK